MQFCLKASKGTDQEKEVVGSSGLRGKQVREFCPEHMLNFSVFGFGG